MPSIKPSNGAKSSGPGIQPAIISTPKSSRGTWVLAAAGIVAGLLALRSCEDEPATVSAPPLNTNTVPAITTTPTVTESLRAAPPFAAEFYVATKNLDLYQADLQTIIGTIEQGSCVRRFTLFNEDTVISDGLRIIAEDTTGYNKAGYVAFRDLEEAPRNLAPNQCLSQFIPAPQ